jgi:hypothetical protein
MYSPGARTEPLGTSAAIFLGVQNSPPTKSLSCQSVGKEAISLMRFVENSNSHNLYSRPAKVRVTLRLAVYRQSVRLGAKLLEAHHQRFFFQLDPCGYSPCVTSSLTRGWVSLLWIGFVFVKRTYRTCSYSMLLKIVPYALYIKVLCQSRICRAEQVMSALSYATTAA